MLYRGQTNVKGNTMNLRGKVALVTGAGAGIGRGCAIELARAGAGVVVNDLPGNKDLDDIVGTIERMGGICIAIEGDVFDSAQAQALVRNMLERTSQQIDILVTGPASTIRKPAFELEPDDYLKVLNDNYVSHIYLAKLVAQEMIKYTSGGNIIFISSIYGDPTITREGSSPYDEAKSALNKATRNRAKEWAKYGIRVNAIAPGFTDTPGEHKLATDEEIKEVVSKLPLRRAGTPRDIGELAVFLASTKHTTGQVITIAGGHDLVDLYDK